MKPCEAEAEEKVSKGCVFQLLSTVGNWGFIALKSFGRTCRMYCRIVSPKDKWQGTSPTPVFFGIWCVCTHAHVVWNMCVYVFLHMWWWKECGKLPALFSNGSTPWFFIASDKWRGVKGF